MTGNLEIITGCMFSGKTEELARRLHRLLYAHQAYILIKPTIDDRCETFVATHHDLKLFAYLLAPGNETLAELVKIVGEDRLEKADVVAFDEGQFFSDKLAELCEELVTMGKRVIVDGLDLDFCGQPFGPMPALFALADRVDKLQAICTKCGKPATRSQRLVNGELARLDSPLIEIGGEEAYEARCRNCWESPK